MKPSYTLWMRIAVAVALAALLMLMQACGSGALCDDYCDKMDECGLGLGSDCVEACELRVASEGEDYFQCVVDKKCAEIPSCN